MDQLLVEIEMALAEEQEGDGDGGGDDDEEEEGNEKCDSIGRTSTVRQQQGRIRQREDRDVGIDAAVAVVPPPPALSTRRGILLFALCLSMGYVTMSWISESNSNRNIDWSSWDVGGGGSNSHVGDVQLRPRYRDDDDGLNNDDDDDDGQFQSFFDQCSCLNKHSYRSQKTGHECCQRAVLRAHKMGYMLTQQLFKPFEKFGIERGTISLQRLQDDSYIDYRHVVMTRNLYDASVSGYLYHKSGRECWLNFNGDPRAGHDSDSDATKPQSLNWEKYVATASKTEYPYPDGNGRSICRYLADESVEDGLRVYVDVALNKWYADVMPYYHRSQELLETERQFLGVQEPQQPKTLFVCFEDASNPDTEGATFDKMMDFLYPGDSSTGNNSTTTSPKFKMPIAVSSSTSAATSSYEGPHATSHDPELRQQLFEIVQSLDRRVFNGTLKRMNDVFRCGM